MAHVFLRSKYYWRIRSQYHTMLRLRRVCIDQLRNGKTKQYQDGDHYLSAKCIDFREKIMENWLNDATLSKLRSEIHASDPDTLHDSSKMYLLSMSPYLKV